MLMTPGWTQNGKWQRRAALHRSGRQAEAPEEYRRVRERLAAEVGIDPSPPLQRLHQQILTTDPVLADTTARSAGVSQVVARQLPADLTGFTGRAGYLADLDRTLDKISSSDFIRPPVLGAAYRLAPGAGLVTSRNRVVPGNGRSCEAQFFCREQAA
jgi:hypothetical protein